MKSNGPNELYKSAVVCTKLTFYFIFNPLLTHTQHRDPKLQATLLLRYLLFQYRTILLSNYFSNGPRQAGDIFSSVVFILIQ